MKLLAVSDVVEPAFYRNFDNPAPSEVDLIVSCGDLPPEYLTFLMSTGNAPLYYVRGNHDIRYIQKPPMGAMNLHGQLVTFRGLRLLGLEGSRWYNGGPIQYTESQMRREVRNLAAKLWWYGGVDIVVTHAPPRYVHDAEDLCHRGFKVFRKLIDKYRPRYLLHGHIHGIFDHPSQRMTVVNQTIVVNSCGYIVLDIEENVRA
jgi:Icc-related predicted phosphoesterase